jgi:hypothetical protein
MMKLRFVPGLMAGLLFVSCGGGGGGGTASEFIASYCDFLAPCCGMAGLKSDGKQCRALLGALAPAMYNPAAGEACLAELRGASGKADFCSSGVDSASCDGAFPQSSSGTKKPGETCTQDDECAPSTEGKVECQTLFSSGAEIRKCQLQVIGKEGDQPCVGTVEGNGTSYVFGSGNDIPARGYLCRVADGLHCDRTTQACTKFKAVGADCSGGDECGSSAFCGSDRKCTARKNVGEACSGGFGSREECVAAAFCQDSSMTCAAKLGSGAACTDSDECKSSSCVNGKCEGDVPVNFGLALLCGS